MDVGSGTGVICGWVEGNGAFPGTRPFSPSRSSKSSHLGGALRQSNGSTARHRPDGVIIGTSKVRSFDTAPCNSCSERPFPDPCSSAHTSGARTMNAPEITVRRKKRHEIRRITRNDFIDYLCVRKCTVKVNTWLQTKIAGNCEKRLPL